MSFTIAAKLIAHSTAKCLMIGRRFAVQRNARTLLWNFSLFPYTLPLGVFLFYKAVVKKDMRLAMPAGLLFSPYFAVFSLFSLLVGLLEHPRLLAVAWLVTWVGMITLALLI